MIVKNKTNAFPTYYSVPLPIYYLLPLSIPPAMYSYLSTIYYLLPLPIPCSAPLSIYYLLFTVVIYPLSTALTYLLP